MKRSLRGGKRVVVRPKGMRCPFCRKSSGIRAIGTIVTIGEGRKHRWKCAHCGHSWTKGKVQAAGGETK